MKKLISIILSAITVLCCTFGATAEDTLPFTDVKSSAWYYSSVSTVYAEGIMEGKGEGKFAPKESMTRAELVTVLCRLSADAYEGKGEALTFKDTKKSAWYADFVAWAVECGIVLGYEDNTFRPNAPVLRCELAKMFVGFLEYMNTPMDGVPLVESFTDSASFPKWAADYIDTLRRTGIMGGDTAGNFNPRANASRAEIATVITRLLPMLRGDVTDIFVDGKSVFTFVYDDSDAELARVVVDLVGRLRLDESISIKSVRASAAEADYGREIVIGNARESGRLLGESLETPHDFAIRIEGDDIILGSNDAALYPYMVKVFESEVLSKIKDRNLSVDSSYSFTYSESDIYGKSYEKYLVDSLKGGADISGRELQNLFEYKSYTDKLGIHMNYRVYVPAYYDEKCEYPVLLFLHGAGEKGSDNEIQLTVMMNSMFNQDNALLTEAIVIAPQCSYDMGWWEVGSLKRLLDTVCDEYSVDHDRIYVMGYSMGGFGSFDLITSYTDTFAAAVPICSGASASDAYTLENFPLYIVHGAKDNTCPVSGSRTIVNALKNLGSTSVVYEELPNHGHNVWGYTANKPEILEWLFEQDLSARK